MDGLNYVIKLLNNKENLFSKVYAFTTENISGYYDELSFENKDILTVTASGDQLLNAVLFGSKNIDCFDSNPLARYYTELKIAAIKVLNKEEFLNYFCKGENSLNYETYLKIKDKLDLDYMFFWDNMYNQFKPSKIRKIVFNNDEYDKEKIIKFNPYLQDFDMLKLLLNDININYFTCDIKDLSKYLNKKYDTIILSNIIQYAECMYEKDALLEFKKLIQKIGNYLNPNGKIMCGYLYNFEYDNVEYLSKKNIFSPNEYEYLKITGIRDDEDGIILFTK